MSRSVRVKELDQKAFAPYGSYAAMLDPETLVIGEKPVEFFRDMLLLDLGGKGQASFSVCRVEKREPVIDVTEFHTATAELNLALDGDMLIHVGPAMPNGEVPLDCIEVFRVPKGTAVSMRPGVWHHAPFVVNTPEVNCLVVLPERTYANDCQVYEIPEGDRIRVEV